ncbi:MAG: hypothetical protein IPK82_25155 [Polyangiaceae bacterium]|nr:hypothetical protein [Polyangiaceae bacterium]
MVPRIEYTFACVLKGCEKVYALDVYALDVYALDVYAAMARSQTGESRCR